VGGVVDGESVEDFIYQFKDLIPVRPNGIGFNLPAGINSGVPSWGFLNSFFSGGTALTGGWADALTTRPSHYVVPTASTTFILSGMSFPADRGVLAFYKNLDGNFYNAGSTTLIAALWLGTTPSPAGIPDSAFSEALRPVQQLNYTATTVGLDLIDLTWRLPYLTSYAAYPGAPYSVYTQNFPNYQLATYALAPQAVAAGDAGNFLVVHWKETYATSLAAIQPANLTLPNLVSANCYSATPVAGNFDDNAQPVFNVNRHRVFRDTNSGLPPTVNTFTTLNANVPATQQYSGVTFTNVNTLQFNVTLSANNLLNNAFQTGSVASPPDVPAQFESPRNPMVLSFSDFGGGSCLIPYYDLRKQGIPGNYSIANAPQVGDIGEFINATLPITTPLAAFTPTNASGFSLLSAIFYKLFATSPVLDLSKRYLYNSFPAAGGALGSATSTLDPFVDEHYRYISLYVPVGAEPIVPAGGNIYNSATSLAADVNSLQVVANCLVYPQTDFSTAAYFPAGNPDYSACAGTRRHVRVFDTGVARNTGKLRIQFLPAFGSSASFTVDAAYTGVETVGHITGGMIIQVKVPGVTGWLDLGRPLGDPGLATLDYYGCSTSVVVAGLDITVSFQTTAFTANNGSGEFPIFVRVTMLDSVAGRSLRLNEMEWLAP
jgi:hypothetical protein